MAECTWTTYLPIKGRNPFIDIIWNTVVAKHVIFRFFSWVSLAAHPCNKCSLWKGVPVNLSKYSMMRVSYMVYDQLPAFNLLLNNVSSLDSNDWVQNRCVPVNVINGYVFLLRGFPNRLNWIIFVMANCHILASGVVIWKFMVLQGVSFFTFSLRIPSHD